ncbi:DUF1876 domain-containing protein [Natronosporangium hydrolyticum]|uniref:DUF1876 domain-containing protein n=1 Tax=Natronosporangium hydrolyticum TaxID=2811111 RepID=A0A895YBL5_9ACTN|nr:DUF1876 domain-containing protein [Natronosporangium hydrolyticum]QSB15157.1 DUF1876 domain-containing protein [Natronosporangium hydrolyticum]
MTAMKSWAVEVEISEHDDERRTQAEARLRTGKGVELRGVGVAWRNPTDLEVPEIGDELAAARALSDLAGKLRETAADDIGQMTHERVWLGG